MTRLREKLPHMVYVSEANAHIMNRAEIVKTIKLELQHRNEDPDDYFFAMPYSVDDCKIKEVVYWYREAQGPYLKNKDIFRQSLRQKWFEQAYQDGYDKDLCEWSSYRAMRAEDTCTGDECFPNQDCWEENRSEIIAAGRFWPGYTDGEAIA